MFTLLDGVFLYSRSWSSGGGGGGGGVSHPYILCAWPLTIYLPPSRTLLATGLCCVMLRHSVMSDSATPLTVALQALQSMGILQVRILEWLAMHSSRGSS